MKLTFALPLLFLSSIAFSAANAGKPEENKVMEQLTEQILNTIDRSSLDLNVNGITFDSQAVGSKVKADDIHLTGKVSFAGNWAVDIMDAKPAKEEGEAADKFQKVYPKIQADAKSIKLDVDLKMRPDSATLQVQFNSHYDAKTGKGVPRPLTIRVTNQMNKELLTIRLFSIQATHKVSAQNPLHSEVSGTCVSDKILLDFATGQNKQVPVDCKFSGTVTEKGYKVQFRYANK